MIWALTKFNLFDDRLARQFSIKCAEHVLHFFEEERPNDKSPRQAIQAAQDFLDGKITQEQLDAARDAARDAGEKESKWQAETLRGLIDPFKKGTQ